MTKSTSSDEEIVVSRGSDKGDGDFLGSALNYNLMDASLFPLLNNLKID
jgi:hypothetical protein